jgi:single-strand DNA-binding protein
MCRMENSVQLIGKVCSIPKVIVTRQGVKQASFVLATSERYKNSSKETITDTDFHFAITRGKLAEFIEKKVCQGKMVAIEGKLCSRRVVKEEVKSYWTEVLVREMMVVGMDP